MLGQSSDSAPLESARWDGKNMGPIVAELECHAGEVSERPWRLGGEIPHEKRPRQQASWRLPQRRVGSGSATLAYFRQWAVSSSAAASSTFTGAGGNS